MEFRTYYKLVPGSGPGPGSGPEPIQGPLITHFCHEIIGLGRKRVPMARYGLILRQDEARSSRLLLNPPKASWEGKNFAKSDKPEF